MFTGKGVLQNLATTIQQLLLLLLDAVSATPSPGASQAALPASSVTASVAVTSITGCDESMSIVPPSPGTAMQVGWIVMGRQSSVATAASFLRL